MMIAEISDPMVAVILCAAVGLVVVVSFLSWRKR
jgi:hypothetical protein